ncbi:hypothetical protein [Paraburkholderia fungorum]|uniref:hypothetical protein n=1 Tax=Paraburkholderia fungorum TaxID=134537 RepID=UPI0011600604|nr:hypothetical protein [Paraburkholderia fungorum]
MSKNNVIDRTVPVPRFLVQWRNTRRSILAIITFASVLIGLILPTDVLDLVPALREFCHSINRLFPVVGNYAARSNFPQVTELYFSTHLLLGPLASVWALTARDLEKERRFREAGFGISQALTFLLAIALAIWGLRFGYFSNPGYDFRIAPINSSRVALAFFGFFIAGSGPFMFAAAVYRTFAVLFINNYKENA